MSAPISAREGTPQSVIACWIGAWSGDTEDDRENALELLSAAIDHAFNPPDEDSDQGSILERAILRAGAYIESLPCTCTGDDEPCGRCNALGRFMDKPVAR